MPRAVWVVLWLLSVAVAFIEGWPFAWVVVGMGLGRYGANVQWHARLQIADHEWRAGA